MRDGLYVRRCRVTSRSLRFAIRRAPAKDAKNITQATLFPGLDGLARSIAYEFEYSWEVCPPTIRSRLWWIATGSRRAPLMSGSTMMQRIDLSPMRTRALDLSADHDWRASL
jgi:hypothetical protein